jgi:hypothetical protein
LKSAERDPVTIDLDFCVGLAGSYGNRRASGWIGRNDGLPSQAQIVILLYEPGPFQDRIAVAASHEPEDSEDVEVDVEPRLLPRGLAVFDMTNGACLRALQFDQPLGTILAIGKHHILSLYRHPKLIELSTGKVLHVWIDLHSGLQDGSIVWGLKDDAMPPPMAFDTARNRFAVVNRDTVTVIEFNHLALSSR